MAEFKVENDFYGDWLWTEQQVQTSSRVLLRKEFSLGSMVSIADLWISSFPVYHLYINGMHVGCGPSAPTEHYCCGDHYDVAQYLEAGTNVIAIETYAQNRSGYFAEKISPGVWCQLNINRNPEVWTNHTWKIYAAKCCASHSPMRHVGLGTILKTDLSLIPAGWKNAGFYDGSWSYASVISPVGEHFPPLQISKDEHFLWNETEIPEPVMTGSFQDKMQCLYLSYALLKDFAGGIWFSETFIRSEQETDADLVISSDDPYILYCNDMEAHRSMDRATVTPEMETGDSFKVGDSLLQSAAVHLKKGWNRLLCIQDAVPSSMGFLIVFPGLGKGAVSFFREADEGAMPGWNVQGPLKMPFAFVSPSLTADLQKCESFLPLPQHLNDAATFLHSCTFVPDSRIHARALKEGEYAVYDLEGIRSGYPVFGFEGNAGDVVDVTTGVHFAENRVRSIGPYGRGTDTLILAGAAEKDRWMRMEPMGCRYIMITVRKAKSAVRPTVHFATFATDRYFDLDFQCSNPVLNEIWKKALFACEQCTGSNISDNICGRRCQSLVESYLYSRLLYTVSGTSGPAAQALRQFAESQLENGMIRSIVPSGIYAFAPDSSLVWILWLHEHYMAGGDPEFLKSMMPVLHRLLNFFRITATRHNGLLTTEVFGKTEFLNDSGDMEEQGVFTALNALYCRAFLTAENLYRAVGDEENAEVCRRTASVIADAVRQLAYDPEKGLFADCSVHGVRSSKYSAATNIMAVFGGLAPKEIQKTILNRILEVIRDPVPFANARITGFLLDALFAFNKQQEALDFIRGAWEYNRSMENKPSYMNLQIFPMTAANFLIREVLGIRPAKPGMMESYFNPACGVLKEARGRISTENGILIAEWSVDEKKELSVSIDSMFPLKITPVFTSEVSDCTFKFGSRVNLSEQEKDPAPSPKKREE